MNPIITLQKAIWLSAFHTCLYVGVLYVREASRPSPIKNKDVPSVIKARILGVIVAVVLSVLLNRVAISKARSAGQLTGIRTWDEIPGGWGEWRSNLNQTFRALLLTAVFFFGPIVETLWIEGGWKYIGEGVVGSLTTIRGWRNYITVVSFGLMC